MGCSSSRLASKDVHAVRSLLRSLPDVYKSGGESTKSSDKNIKPVRLVMALVMERSPGNDLAPVVELKDEGTEEVRDIELLRSVVAMRTAASQLGDALKEKDYASVHIKGEKHLFGCRDVSDSLLLVFYLESDARALRKFEIEDAHESALKKLCADIDAVLSPHYNNDRD